MSLAGSTPSGSPATPPYFATQTSDDARRAAGNRALFKGGKRPGQKHVDRVLQQPLADALKPVIDPCLGEPEFIPVGERPFPKAIVSSDGLRQSS
jgi:hypothetical protein